MQMVADMRGVGVKNREKLADVLCGRPLTTLTKETYFRKTTYPQHKLYLDSSVGPCSVALFS